MDASGNWWGTTDENAIDALMSGGVDFTPYLDSGTDTELGTAGFQGDFSTLDVTALGEQTGSTGRIQEGVNLVDVGGTVNVGPGIYTAETPNLLINKDNVTVQSTMGAASTSIVGSGAYFALVYITSNGVTFDGFTVDASNNPSGEQKGIRLAGNSIVVKNNVVIGPGDNGSIGLGIFVPGNNNQILNNVVHDWNNTGISIGGSATTGVGTLVEGNEVYANYDGIYIDRTPNNMVLNNNAHDNFRSGILDAQGVGGSGGGALISGNTVSSNGATVGSTLGRGIYLFGSNATVQNNQILNNTGYGLYIRDGFEGTQPNTTVSGNTVNGNTSAFVLENVDTINLTDNSSSGNTSGGSFTTVTTVNLTTNDSDNTVDINGASVGMNQFGVVGQLQAIGYSGVTNLNVDTLDGDDIVNVAAHATTLIDLNGGLPNVPLGMGEDGDTLNYLSDGVNGFNIGPSTITTAGHANITYANFETVNVSGDLLIDGSAGDDTLIVTATNSNSGTFQLIQDGVAGPVVGFSGISSLTFNGLAGDDILRINNPAGGVFDPTNGIIYNGGDGGEGNTPAMGDNPTGDKLEILGGMATSVEHRFDSDSAGSVFYNSEGTATISYTGLEPILDTIAATDRVFTYKGAAETVTLSDDGDVGDGESLIDSDLGESVTFADPSGTLTINTETAGGSGADAVNVEGARFHLRRRPDNQRRQR